MSTQNLLIELLVEELPPKALKKLGQVFAQSLRQGLVDQSLLDPQSGEDSWQSFATPRRLGVWIKNV